MIVLFSGAEEPGVTITNITDTSGLTWLKRSALTAVSDAGSPGTQTAEIWYTVNTAGFQVHSAPTIHYSGTFDDQAVILGAWDGVNLSSIWAGGDLLGGTKGDVGA